MSWIIRHKIGIIILNNLIEETLEEVVDLAVASGAFVLAEEIDRLRGKNS